MISRLGQSNQIHLLTIRADWSLGTNASVSGYFKWKKKEDGQFAFNFHISTTHSYSDSRISSLESTDE